MADTKIRLFPGYFVDHPMMRYEVCRCTVLYEYCTKKLKFGERILIRIFDLLFCVRTLSRVFVARASYCTVQYDVQCGTEGAHILHKRFENDEIPCGTGGYLVPIKGYPWSPFPILYVHNLTSHLSTQQVGTVYYCTWFCT